ncbi:MAG TPA: hypothetical protein VMJ35_13260 [Dongiaceae bacterium]|nr:hypothetical protein [Dongiaceae bacterium]
MDLKISPELQTKLERLAAHQGRDVGSLVSDALERLVDYDEWFLGQVEKGAPPAEESDFLEDTDVGQRLEDLIRRTQRRS